MKIKGDFMRTKREEIKCYINEVITRNKRQWKFEGGKNSGTEFQRIVRDYFNENAEKHHILRAKSNENPNDPRTDVYFICNEGECDGYEVKSIKDGSLPGLTICNNPLLLNDKKVLLINYTVDKNSTISVLDVYETQIFRLTSINSSGKYKGCLMSTRDTGKKIKGRNFNDFINTCEDEDYTLEELTNPELVRKTILYYSASKLVDSDYNFTDEEILEAVHNLKESD